jgi:hypothetical protein
MMCDRQIVFTLLEILTLMRRSCEHQFTDEVSLVQANVTVGTDGGVVFAGTRV